MDFGGLIVSSELNDCATRRDEYLAREDAHATLVGAAFLASTGASDVLSVRVPQGDLVGYDFPEPTGRCSRGQDLSFLLAIDHEACTVTVSVRIFLNPDGEVDLTDRKKASWKAAIEDAWSDHFTLVRTAGRAPCHRYRILVEARWIADAGDPKDHTVRVRAGSDRPHMREWWSDGDEGDAPHEFGHMLGNVDEYSGACDGCPNRPVAAGFELDANIMADNSPLPLPRHFYLVQRAVGRELCSAFDVEGDVVGLVGTGLDDATKAVIDWACEIREKASKGLVDWAIDAVLQGVRDGWRNAF